MRSGRSRFSFGSFWPALLFPVLGFVLVLPLLAHGPSCGHDFTFHVQSWTDAADQLRHGRLWPRWAFSPAYNAGEPRFTFYPPLSWMLGAVLMLSLPAAWVTTAFTWLALTASGVAMYALARRFADRGGAALASAAYLLNPYVLFTAYERTAYAELLAAAWMPLLFRAALAKSPSAVGLGIPLALLWLTNVPAAVMGTYALVTLILLRAVWASLGRRTENRSAVRPLPLLKTGVAGLLLGLSLSGFYLVPAIWERRFVQIALMLIPYMRVQDNFLFEHTGDLPHDQVLHTASVVAVFTAALTAVALLLALVRVRRSSVERELQERSTARETLGVVGLVAVLIFVLLFRFTLPIWNLLPELKFLPFPWRLLAVMGCVLGTATAIALRNVRAPGVVVASLCVVMAGCSQAPALREFRQGCEAGDLPQDIAQLYQTHHGFLPTDEYTAVTADNDYLRWDNPGWWLTQQADAPAPNTLPNPAETTEDYDGTPPVAQTVSGRAPRHLELHLQAPENLVLNLRDYPNWVVTVNGSGRPAHLSRGDGLIAIPLRAGASSIDVRWRTAPDLLIGVAVSGCAVLVAAWSSRRSRRIDA